MDSKQKSILDTTTSTVAINNSIPTSVLKDSNYTILGSYKTDGPSSGSASCSSNLDGVVTNINQLITIGSHTITCTATTGAKKTATTTKKITITYNASTTFTMKNLVTNGSFENGISEWTNGKTATESWMKLHVSDYSYIPKLSGAGDYAFRVQVNNAQSFARARYNTTSTLANHKVYAKVYTLIDSGTDLSPGLYLEFTTGPDMWSEPKIDHAIWYGEVYSIEERRIWRSLSLYETATYNYFKIMLAQQMNGGNGIYLFDGLVVVDLTAAFGAGNEPDKSWCDNHINYFDGTQNIKKN